MDIRRLGGETTHISPLRSVLPLYATAILLLRILNRWHSPYGHLPVTVDARVYLAGLAFTVASALLFGMLPARHAWQSTPLQAMKSGTAESLHLRRFALRDLHVAGQNLRALLRP